MKALWVILSHLFSEHEVNHFWWIATMPIAILLFLSAGALMIGTILAFSPGGHDGMGEIIGGLVLFAWAVFAFLVSLVVSYIRVRIRGQR